MGAKAKTKGGGKLPTPPYQWMEVVPPHAQGSQVWTVSLVLVGTIAHSICVVGSIAHLIYLCTSGSTEEASASHSMPRTIELSNLGMTSPLKHLRLHNTQAGQEISSSSTNPLGHIVRHIPPATHILSRMASKRAAATLVAQLPKLQTPVFRSRQFLQSASRTGPILTTIRQKHTIPRPRFQSSNTTEPFPKASEQQIPDQAQAEDPKPNPSPTTNQLSSSSSSSKSTPPADQSRVKSQPHYELVFTCKPCGERSRHHISKQGYHHGSILISCPSCRNRHVISDHLRIFGDRAITVEDLMKERGQLVKKGTLGEDGDLEFWEDGTVTERKPDAEGMDDLVRAAEEREGSGKKEGKDSWRDTAPGSSFRK